jgi:ElaB/YqjD/DUF883 family membrane-anchored ribosome-binding protein
MRTAALQSDCSQHEEGQTSMAESSEAYAPKISERSRQQAESLIDRTREAAEAIAGQARDVGERAGEYAGDVGAAMKQHPYATVAIAAGLAFAIGALWKVRSSSRQSQMEALLSRLPELPSRDRLFARRWR